jgi:hypothetical protein
VLPLIPEAFTADDVVCPTPSEPHSCRTGSPAGAHGSTR